MLARAKPAEKCDKALMRRVLARAVEGPVKALFVIDTEGEANAEESSVLRHFKSTSQYVQVRVTTVEPKHEVWLCKVLEGIGPPAAGTQS
jgi:hypothetical protein